MAADTPHARLAELADMCERTDTGDGVMEIPLTQARQIGADLRAVLNARAATPSVAPAEREIAAYLSGLYDGAHESDDITDEECAHRWRIHLRDTGGTPDAETRELARRVAVLPPATRPAGATSRAFDQGPAYHGATP